jgi:hypothetical protein
MLTAAGELDLRVGGPNIDGAGDIDANDTSSQNIEYGYTFADLRRGVYTPAFRNKRHELFEVFDFADIISSQGRRGASTVAPQALFLLNHPWVASRATAAGRRLAARPGTVEERIDHAWLLTLGRTALPAERAAASEHLTTNDSPDGWASLVQSLFASADFRLVD